MSNRTNWRKHRPVVCRKCGATENLTPWFTVLLCPEHLPERRCLDCHQMPSETPFRTVMHRRCIACEQLHIFALHRRYDAKKIKNRRPASPHVKWIRGLPCTVHAGDCRGGVAHHVRHSTGGGTGLRPHDRWCVPLCHEAHMEGHDGGWQTFEAKHHVDLRAEAMRLAALSPALVDKPKPASYSGAQEAIA